MDFDQSLLLKTAHKALFLSLWCVRACAGLHVRSREPAVTVARSSVLSQQYGYRHRSRVTVWSAAATAAARGKYSSSGSSDLFTYSSAVACSNSRNRRTAIFVRLQHR